jgi:2-dehydro-3-deoxyphosphogluconate aldolase/(4S)-4-hydroxy-2-oxoglutarate aldolase
VDAIGAITAELPEMLVGAGTVRSVEQTDEAVTAGAKFLVAPGLNERVIRHSAELDVPILPGVCTPTEVEQALSMNVSLLKFFPAEAAGGVGYLSALAAPFPDVQFLPTGGIGPDNLSSYLSLPNVVACGGSWMVAPSLISAGDFDSVTRLTSEALCIAAAAKRVAT